jgi:Sec-independent protein translocase protein TatA
MFGIGFGELIVILLAVIVFINPKDLPAFVRKVGRAWGELRSLKDKFKGE